jgi:hypothetical protein
MTVQTGFYDERPDSEYYYQGDILRDMPYPAWPILQSSVKEPLWPILRPLRQRPPDRQLNLLYGLPDRFTATSKREVKDAFSLPGGELIISKVEMKTVMVLSRSCSLDSHQKHLLIAPVDEVSLLPISDEERERRLTQIRGNEILHYFHLPEKQGVLAESVANLLAITYLHKTFLPEEEVRPKLVARLSPHSTAQLQHQLSRHFGAQQFGFDHEDICPQTAIYSCSCCFYRGKPVIQRTVLKDEMFGPCENCGADATFIKLP